MTTEGGEGTGPSSLLAGSSYGEVNPTDFIVLPGISAKFATISLKMMSQVMCHGDVSGDEARTSSDKRSVSAQGYK